MQSECRRSREMLPARPMVEETFCSTADAGKADLQKVQAPFKAWEDFQGHLSRF